MQKYLYNLSFKPYLYTGRPSYAVVHTGVSLTAGVRDDNRRSPLDVALDEGSVDNGDVGLYLMKHHGCGDEQDKAKVLCKACGAGNMDLVKELVEQHNVDPTGEYITCNQPLRNSMQHLAFLVLHFSLRIFPRNF